MAAKHLRFLIASIFLSVLALFAKAQQIHFVYIQTTDLQPFYVKIGPKIISSSTSGYVILPKMQDGNYDLVVGFPKNEYPEEDFPVQIQGKNLGFLLKDFGDKGWGLFDRESFQITMGGAVHPDNTAGKDAHVDAFSKMLASVVKDSTILQKSTPKSAPVPGVNADTFTGEKRPQASFSSSVPVLLSRHKTSGGLHMIYAVPGDHGSDTIDVVLSQAGEIKKGDSSLLAATSLITGVPAPPSGGSPEGISDSGEQKKYPRMENPQAPSPVFLDQITTAVKADSGKTVNSPKFNPAVSGDSAVMVSKEPSKQTLEQPMDTLSKGAPAGLKESVGQPKTDYAPVTPEKQAVTQTNPLPAVINSSAINSDCKAFATNEDFLRLRKKMAAANSDEGMIAAADNEFHLKCYSTEQVKNLSYLFLTDKGRFNFLVSAYPFTSDSDQYFTLRSLLSDPFYVNKFKAMVHK